MCPSRIKEYALADTAKAHEKTKLLVPLVGITVPLLKIGFIVSLPHENVKIFLQKSIGNRIKKRPPRSFCNSRKNAAGIIRIIYLQPPHVAQFPPHFLLCLPVAEYMQPDHLRRAALPHAGQITSSSWLFTSSSNVFPQFSHTYSNIGIIQSLRCFRLFCV